MYSPNLLNGNIKITRELNTSIEQFPVHRFLVKLIPFPVFPFNNTLFRSLFFRLFN